MATIYERWFNEEFDLIFVNINATLNANIKIDHRQMQWILKTHEQYIVKKVTIHCYIVWTKFLKDFRTFALFYLTNVDVMFLTKLEIYKKYKINTHTTLSCNEIAGIKKWESIINEHVKYDNTEINDKVKKLWVDTIKDIVMIKNNKEFDRKILPLIDFAAIYKRLPAHSEKINGLNCNNMLQWAQLKLQEINNNKKPFDAVRCEQLKTLFTNTSSKRWNCNYDEWLKKYEQMVNIPAGKLCDNLTLYIWRRVQRVFYTECSGKMTEIALYNKWSDYTTTFYGVDHNQAIWDVMYNKYATFISKKNKHPVVIGDSLEYSLAHWFKIQRYNMENNLGLMCYNKNKLKIEKLINSI